MHVRYSLNQIDDGVILHLLRGVLRLFYGAACKFNGRPNCKITGMDMCHLLLLLPFFLFDLLKDEEHNSLNCTAHESPASDLISWVLVLLELQVMHSMHAEFCNNNK